MGHVDLFMLRFPFYFFKKAFKKFKKNLLNKEKKIKIQQISSIIKKRNRDKNITVVAALSITFCKKLSKISPYSTVVYTPCVQILLEF